MTFGFLNWATSQRLVSAPLAILLLISVSGCGGCGGSSPSDKLARFNFTRAPDADEQAAKAKPAAEAKPSATAAQPEKPAETPPPKPAEEVKPQPAATPAPAPAAQPATSKPEPAAQPAAAAATTPAPATTVAATEPGIAGAQKRQAVIEAMKLMPVGGSDRAATKARSHGLMALVGQALAQQIAETKSIPATAPVDATGRQFLSWRVHLLPYLGYDELYKKFQLNEPWDSPTNIKLSTEIPFVYATPGYQDDRTNLVLLTGPTCAANDRRATPISALTSRSLYNSVVMVELADPQARPVWTKPEDLAFDPSIPSKGLTGWPDKKFLAVTADGEVHDVPVTNQDHLNRLFVVSNPIDLSEIASAPTLPGSMASAGTNISLTSTQPMAGPVSRNDLDPSKMPLPETAEIDAAAIELRRLFQNEVREADQDHKKAEIASKLLKHAEYLQNDPVKQCAALQIAYRFAILAKSPILLKDAFEQLQRKYQVDSFSSDMFIVRFGSENIQRIPAHRLPEFRSIARTILNRAIADNNFPAIDELIRIGTFYAASQNDQRTMTELDNLKSRNNAAKKDYDAIQARFLSLEVPSLDEQGNLMVGKFWCIHRDNWEKGFEFLLRSNDDRLQYLAETEMTTPADPRIQFKIAEGWWEIGIASPPGTERNRFLGRAAQWYKKSDQNMTDSLEKVTAQQQLQEFTRLTGVRDIPSL
ncbi:DUF1559 domain-containing protein [Bremerella sp. JC817]|uniref:DUF1559 family PulG-like putative transporter n=1 Tax=Bremerella sp. JC817 TaxID=3231756 RepID=UPI00345B0877